MKVSQITTQLHMLIQINSQLINDLNNIAYELNFIVVHRNLLSCCLSCRFLGGLDILHLINWVCTVGAGFHEMTISDVLKRQRF